MQLRFRGYHRQRKHRRFNAREPARLQRVPDRRVVTQPGNPLQLS